MSRKNYSKFFEPDNNDVQLEVTHHLTMQTELDEEVINEEVVNEEVINEMPNPYGIVTGCKRLNVRKESNKESDVVCIIDEGAEVVIDSKSSTTEDFYKVTTSNGVEGYCMKKFITIK